MLSTEQVEGIRSRFKIFQRKVFLNSCSQGALSEDVQAGVEEYLATWHQYGSPWELWIERYEQARAAFASFINASPDEVAIVTSVSAGLNGVASALPFQERKTVVMGEFEFPTMGHVWLGQRPRGAEVRFVSAVGDSIPIHNYEKMIDRSTCIVPLTHVCFKNGFRSDVGAVTKIAHDAGALVMLDDYQDCGTRPVDVKGMNLDFYVTGTLKYLLGPPGLAFLYVRKELIATLAPTVTGWFAQADPFAYNAQHFELSPTARRFESGSPAVPNFYAALPGFQLLQRIGMEKVAAHIKHLAQTLLKQACDLGILVKTPADTAGPLIVLQSKDSTQLVQKLAAAGIITSNRYDGLRISFHVYNTMSDVTAVMEILKQNLDLMVLATGVPSHA
jgi:selenocysteine lyase/cysteine desulfurase